MQITFSAINKIAYVNLNRPKKKNAITQQMISDMYNFFLKIKDNTHVEVIVIKSTGDTFCSGLDLFELSIYQNKSYEANLENSRALKNLYYEIYNSNKITIAQIEGDVIGGGCGLISACDFVFAIENVNFAFPEIKLSFVPAIISPFLLKKIGKNKLKEFLLTGKSFPSLDAQKYGLINRVFKKNEIAEKITNFINEILINDSAEAVSLTKKLLNQIDNDSSLEDQLNKCVEINTQARFLKKCKQRVNDFINKA